MYIYNVSVIYVCIHVYVLFMSISFYFYNKYLTYAHEVFGIINEFLLNSNPCLYTKLLINGTCCNSLQMISAIINYIDNNF